MHTDYVSSAILICMFLYSTANTLFQKPNYWVIVIHLPCSIVFKLKGLKNPWEATPAKAVMKFMLTTEKTAMSPKKNDCTLLYQENIRNGHVSILQPVAVDHSKRSVTATWTTATSSSPRAVLRTGAPRAQRAAGAAGAARPRTPQSPASSRPWGPWRRVFSLHRF